ncbi:MAG: hypothetical protein J5817_01415 [Treponema sp.]|nr:hypothetical protein [Treponema sp.]
MKKAILTATTMLISICIACGAKAISKKPKTLIEHGLSLISLMKEKAGNQSFLNLMSNGNDGIAEKMKEIASGNVSKSSAVYCMSGDFYNFGTFLFNRMDLSGTWKNPEEDFYSAPLKEEMNKRFVSAIPASWNARVGSTELAVASLLQSEKAFVSKELKSDCIYIFEFQDTYPVAVCFMLYDNNAVLAKSSYIFDRDYVPQLKEVLEKFGKGIKLEQIK